MFVPKMVPDKWTGTMNLTEPQCAPTSACSAHQAVNRPTAAYKITGTKIFISSRRARSCENIIHLVLARIEGAPAAFKGVVRCSCAEDPGQCRWIAGRAQRRVLWFDRAQDGHSRNSTCVMNYDGAPAG